MDEQDKALLDKFTGVIESLNAGADEAAARKFFASLSRDEYDRLIYIFHSNDFPGINPETKSKLLSVLNKLREAVK